MTNQKEADLKEMTEEEVSKAHPEDLLATVERLERANEKMEKLMREQKDLVARNLLGGQSSVGEPRKEEKKELSDFDYADLALQGALPEENGSSQ